MRHFSTVTVGAGDSRQTWHLAVAACVCLRQGGPTGIVIEALAHGRMLCVNGVGMEKGSKVSYHLPSLGNAGSRRFVIIN